MVNSQLLHRSMFLLNNTASVTSLGNYCSMLMTTCRSIAGAWRRVEFARNQCAIWRSWRNSHQPLSTTLQRIFLTALQTHRNSSSHGATAPLQELSNV